MRTIVVATDFSEEAENALEYAGALAKDLHARVVIFNSYTVPIHIANALIPADSMKEVAKQNEEVLKKRANRLSKKYGIETAYECKLLIQVAEQLREIYERYHADFIVLGISELSFTQDLLGNTATATIMMRYYPVLAIPAGNKYHGFKKILFATDVFGKVQEKALDKIKYLCSEINTEIEVFQVQESIKQIKKKTEIDQINTNVEGVHIYYKNVDSNAVIEAIEKEIHQIKADLLIMMPHKYGFWRSLIHRSKTRIMISKVEIPLLSIPETNE